MVPKHDPNVDPKLDRKQEPKQDEPRRSRRTYLCGPCKRFKMKCNMELPCRLCVQAKRAKECYLLPPNPPSEEEKTKIARRRLRNSRKRELEQQKKLPISPTTYSPNLSPQHLSQSPTLDCQKNHLHYQNQNFNHQHHQHSHYQHQNQNHLHLGHLHQSHPLQFAPSAHLLALTSPLNPLVASRDDSLRLLLMSSDLHALFPLQPDPVPVRVHLGINIHNLPFMAEYAAECKKQAVLVPAATAQRWKLVALQVSGAEVASYFAQYYYWEHAGVHELVDVAAALAAAHAMLRKLHAMSDYSPWCVDRYLLQCMAVACWVLAEGDSIEGHTPRAGQWMGVANDIKELLGPYRLLGECLFLAQLVVSLKIAYVALDRMADFAREFDMYLAAVLAAPEFVALISRDNLVDLDQFLAAARIWLMIKIIETELSVLQPNASLQYKWAPLQHTIVPDAAIIKRIYGTDFTVPLTHFLTFNVSLLASHEFFRRFENARLPRDVIYLYLTLYSTVCEKLLPCADQLCTVLTGLIDVAVVTQHAEHIAAVYIWFFLLIRWLSIVRADSPHFPSLRFTHYLLTLMTMFNIFNDVDDRLQLPPGAMLDAILKGSHMMVVLQMYNSLCLQAVYLATMARFLRPDSHMHTLDLLYVFRVVLLLLDKTLLKFKVAAPFCQMPVLAQILHITEILKSAATDDLVAADSPQQLFDVFKLRIPPAMWLTLVQFTFGTEENLLNHIQQLWRLGDFATANGANPIPITALLLLNTDLLRQYQGAYLPFWYNTNTVDGYMYRVVDGNQE